MPRPDDHHAEAGQDREQPVAIERAVTGLAGALARCDAGTIVAAFPVRHPEHRHIVRRPLMLRGLPLAGIGGNLPKAATPPIDILCCKPTVAGPARHACGMTGRRYGWAPVRKATGPAPGRVPRWGRRAGKAAGRR